MASCVSSIQMYDKNTSLLFQDVWSDFNDSVHLGPHQLQTLVEKLLSQKQTSKLDDFVLTEISKLLEPASARKLLDNIWQEGQRWPFHVCISFNHSYCMYINAIPDELSTENILKALYDS